MAPLPRVVVATGNPGKVREIRAILAEAPVEWVGVGADAAGDVVFPEEGSDYRANAVAKARAAADQLGLVAVADDSGLEVAALGGAPGPLSARYGGLGLDDAGRVTHLLDAIAEVRGEDRAACFVCWAALAAPDGRVWSFEGRCPGTIALEPRGSGGFGYDPIFALPDDERVMAEVPADEKNRISHRARAFCSLATALDEALGSG